MNNCVKNNVYYYIDNLIKTNKEKYMQLYIFEIKMKLIHFGTLEQFESYLSREQTYVNGNIFKTNIVNNIFKQIKLEKQELCQHLFSHLETNSCEYNENLCPDKFKNDIALKQKWVDAQTGWSMSCSRCGIKTSDLGIKLGFGIQNNYPDDGDLYKLFEICEINNWNIK